MCVSFTYSYKSIFTLRKWTPCIETLVVVKKASITLYTCSWLQPVYYFSLYTYRARQRQPHKLLLWYCYNLLVDNSCDGFYITYIISLIYYPQNTIQYIQQIHYLQNTTTLYDVIIYLNKIIATFNKYNFMTALLLLVKISDNKRKQFYIYVSLGWFDPYPVTGVYRRYLGKSSTGVAVHLCCKFATINVYPTFSLLIYVFIYFPFYGYGVKNWTNTHSLF